MNSWKITDSNVKKNEHLLPKFLVSGEPTGTQGLHDSGGQVPRQMRADCGSCRPGREHRAGFVPQGTGQ